MKKKVEKSNPIIAYKGFDENLCSRCFGFKYEVGKEYHLDNEVELCFNGFHACQNPLDVFVCYPMSSYTRYAMVILWGDVDFAKDGKKLCATDILIIREMQIDELVEVGIMMSTNKSDKKVDDYRIDCDTIVSVVNADSICSNQDFANINSFGHNTSILSTGSNQRIVSNGNLANIDITGAATNVSTSGRRPTIKSTGNMQRVATSGFNPCIISSGDYASVAVSDTGDIYSDGVGASLLASGDASKIASIGNNSNICIDSICGYVNSSGFNARVMSAEDKSTIESTGQNAVVMSAGQYTKAKAKVGSWIVLTEYCNNGTINCVKAEYVDGKRIKEDTLYTLVDGEFVEAYY